MKTGRPRKGRKQCPACGATDPYAFAQNTARSDGLQVYCRDCMRYDYFLSKLHLLLTKTKKF
jgi:late competence protein required for DNA uptake (superfamily II DNA/RNA helicase)